MNAASQDLPRHLGVLRERMLHPDNYELAVSYFLEEFAGDEEFVQGSDPDEAPHLRAVVLHVASKALDQAIRLEDWKGFQVREHRFYHGGGAVSGHRVLFFYFREIDTGIAAVMPGLRGEMEVARFRLTAGLLDPRTN